MKHYLYSFGHLVVCGEPWVKKWN